MRSVFLRKRLFFIDILTQRFLLFASKQTVNVIFYGLFKFLSDNILIFGQILQYTFLIVLRKSLTFLKICLIFRSKQNTTIENRHFSTLSQTNLKFLKNPKIFSLWGVVLEHDSLSSLMFQINARKIRIVDVHLTDSLVQLSPVQRTPGLHIVFCTRTAHSVSENSIKNLVTSPRSKMRMRVTVPKGEKRAKTVSLVISRTIVS